MRPVGLSLETNALEARVLDHALQGVVGNRRTFGDKVMLVCGDFRQILPIVSLGTNVQVLQQCIRRSMLKVKFRALCLRENMRLPTSQTVQDAEEQKEFVEYDISGIW